MRISKTKKSNTRYIYKGSFNIMFITERLIGISIFAILLSVICILVLFSKPNNIGRILFFYTLLLTIMAYLFVPNPGADLYRLIPIMDAYSNASREEILNLMLNSNTPFSVLYLYLIGFLNSPGFLPAITAFIFFFNIFYILKKSAIYLGSKSRDVALVLLLFMSSGIYFEVISGIRNMLAFSIITVCFFKEVIEKKSIIKNIVWYIAASLIHPAALALTLIRFIYFSFQSKHNFKTRILYSIILISGISILFINAPQYLNFMIEKASSYISGGAYSYIWEYLIGVIIFIYIIWCQVLFYSINKNDQVSKNIYNFNKFSILISLILIIFILEYNTFHRFILLNSIIVIPVTLYILNSTFFNKKSKAYFKITLMYLSILLLMLASSRGNLSSLKFFILP